MDRLQRIKRKMLLNASEGYLMLGLFEKALATLDEVSDDGETTTIDLLRGEALRSLERHADALAAYNRVFAVTPNNVSLLLAMAWCYKRTGQLPRAITALEQARRIDPAQAIIPYNLACYWTLAGNREEALTCLQRALTQDGSLKKLIPDEPDFDSLREDPDFQRIVRDGKGSPKVPES